MILHINTDNLRITLMLDRAVMVVLLVRILGLVF